jgi:hypothetical protein
MRIDQNRIIQQQYTTGKNRNTSSSLELGDSALGNSKGTVFCGDLGFLPDETSQSLNRSLSAAFLNMADPTAKAQSGDTDTGGSQPVITAVAADDSAASANDDLADEFSSLTKMTPAACLQAQYLKDHNLTEDDFKKLSPDAQKAIDKEIAEELKRQLN